MAEIQRVLVTGPTGKVGQAFIRRFLAEPKFDAFVVRALCHHRLLEPQHRLEIVRGSIAQLETVQEAMQDVSHVLHLATCKETPDQIMDVAVKGFFWLLETCRTSPIFKQLILIGGDAGIGHFFYPHPLREHLNRNIYHFYVPLYLAMALEAEGRPRKYALAAPMMLTLTYEFVTMAQDYRYLMKDPARVGAKNNLHTLKDIFAGFSGANFGIGKIIPGSFFSRVSESFGHSTQEGVSLLLNPAVPSKKTSPR